MAESDRKSDNPAPGERLDVTAGDDFDDVPAEAPEKPADDDVGDETRDDLEEARRECEELMDRLQRTAADYQNFQKRAARRIEEARTFARRELVEDLLPVIDNFERALEAAADTEAVRAFYDGVTLVHDQLLEALAKHGVEPIEALGEPFDPELHEAVARTPSDQVPSGHVAAVLQTGYRLDETTLRPSRVAVSAGPPEEDAG